MQHHMHSHLSPLPGTLASTSQRPHYFFTREETTSLGTLLKKPYQHFVEMHEYTHLGHVLAFIRKEYPHLSLSLTTETAFHQPVADFFTTHLATLCNVQAAQKDEIKTCLQEAVMNSIIHGNLAIEPTNHRASHFQQYLETVSLRLKNEVLGLRRVSLFAWFTEQHITLCVADQGKGFDFNQPPGDPADPHGRGLMLIRNLCADVWQPQRNHLTMQFLRHA